jgi:hypothetical protein
MLMRARPQCLCHLQAHRQIRTKLRKSAYGTACSRATRPVFFESMFSSARRRVVSGCAASARLRKGFRAVTVREGAVYVNFLGCRGEASVASTYQDRCPRKPARGSILRVADYSLAIHKH